MELRYAEFLALGAFLVQTALDMGGVINRCVSVGCMNPERQSILLMNAWGQTDLCKPNSKLEGFGLLDLKEAFDCGFRACKSAIPFFLLYEVRAMMGLQ
eukprot:1160734-Pelagomonas_calceolata.AAC.2